MPLALSLLGRFWPHLLALALLIGAVWFLDHRGYRRAEREQAAAEARAAALQSELLRSLERKLAVEMEAVGNRLADRLGRIGETRNIIQPVIEREIARAPNLASPGCSMPDSVRDALNAARRAGEDP